MLMFNFCTETFGSCKNMTRHSVNEKIKSFFLKLNNKYCINMYFLKSISQCDGVELSKIIVCGNINRQSRFNYNFHTDNYSILFKAG